MNFRIFQPSYFIKITAIFLPWLVGITLLCAGIGLYQSIISSPPDYQQGETVRIMYIHVPAAWMSLLLYTFMAVSSGAFLVWRNPLADIAARTAAPIGACFTLVTLVTGSLWGKPMWGTWWVWDARLTSMLILFFFYLGYLLLLYSFDNPLRASYSAAVLALIGFVNVPIVKFSVDFWNTLHQPASILRLKGPAIHSSMLIPLLWMIAAAMGYSAVLLIIGIHTKFYEKKLQKLAYRITT